MNSRQHTAKQPTAQFRKAEVVLSKGRAIRRAWRKRGAPTAIIESMPTAARGGEVMESRVMSATMTLVLTATVTVSAAQAQVLRQTYLDLAVSSFAENVKACRAQVEKWTSDYQPDDFWGYAPPGGPVWLTGLAGSLYELTGEERYAEVAIEWLSTHHRFKQYLPDAFRRQRPEYDDGVPALTDFFHLSPFTQAYLRVRASPALTAEHRQRIEQSIAESADFTFSFPEWGPMNRAVLRAEGLARAAEALPGHPNAAKWRQMATVLASDSWGKWEEEDAAIYHPIWLNSLIRYADAIEDPSLFSLVTTRYYFDYFLHLLAPSGMLPAFGDARWNGSWPSYLACFERGASVYHRSDLKWGAQRVFEAMTKDGGRIDSRTALIFTDAYRWAADSIDAAPPTTLSEEVIEDVVGKKIVFRNGWEPDSTYLMLNYRDEGGFALVPRDFLRHTLAVEEEKMHHGHSDENGISLLMSGGSVLLSEAGYRPVMPSGPYGAWRADYFHNRLVARKLKRDRRQPLFEFLRHSGAYRPVTTQKVDFLALEEVDMSRTRVRDEKTGCEADRVIVYLKRENIFIIFDIVKILETDYYTFSTLWHAAEVLDRGEHYYLTTADTADTNSPENQVLLIDFLQHGIRQDGAFPIERRRRAETAVYQAISSHYHAGRIETFTTILAPHRIGSDVNPTLEAVQLLDVDDPRAGMGVRIQRGEDILFVCVKTDLMMDVLTENIRPRYTFESGRVKYGPIETDAAFLYARRTGDELAYAAANMVRIMYDGQLIFTARSTTHGLQPDGSPIRHAPTKWRYWQDRARLP